MKKFNEFLNEGKAYTGVVKFGVRVLEQEAELIKTIYEAYNKFDDFEDEYENHRKKFHHLLSTFEKEGLADGGYDLEHQFYTAYSNMKLNSTKLLEFYDKLRSMSLL